MPRQGEEGLKEGDRKLFSFTEGNRDTDQNLSCPILIRPVGGFGPNGD
jgi:hypothetical protein